MLLISIGFYLKLSGRKSVSISQFISLLFSSLLNMMNDILCLEWMCFINCRASSFNYDLYLENSLQIIPQTSSIIIKQY